MCGIVGGFANKINEQKVQAMVAALKHRGPDSDSFWINSDARFFLGHTRLSIIDLSEAGNQPMICKNKNDNDFAAVVFNGEIYNYQEVREELLRLGWQFSSHSDTEVVVKSFLEWGTECVQKFRGMFAFAAYQSRNNKLYIFRDRFGVKPLYYYQSGGEFIFASELKSIYCHANYKKELEPKALEVYLRFGYIPAPLTIFKNTFKLESGSWLEVGSSGESKKYRYWLPEQYFKGSYADLSEEEILRDLENELGKSFSYRLIADVDVGIFLSGGIDSSLVAALLQKNLKRKLKTFSMGFRGSKEDEAPKAKKIAALLGTDHHEIYVSEKDFFSSLGEYMEIFDEPFGDSSGLPTYFLAKYARKHVKVALSGDGGDELFLGYSKYQAILKLQEMSSPKRRSLITLFSVAGPDQIQKMYQFFSPLLGLSPYSNLREKVDKLRSVLGEINLKEQFISASSYWGRKDLLRLINANQSGSKKDDHLFLDYDVSPAECMQLWDINNYLSDDILVKTDRSTMAVGLEAREPYLDSNILAFMAKIDPKIKFKNAGSKYLLRKILSKYLDPALFEGPKIGFRPPLDDWLKTNLSRELESNLNRKKIAQEGIFNADFVDEIMCRWRAGKYVNPDRLWLLLSFQWWKQKYF